MIKLRVLALTCGVALAVVPFAAAQDKGPAIQKKPVNKNTYEDLLKNYQQGAGSYRFVSGDETLTSGDLVTIARKGGGKVTGIFVYADPKSNRLYVRPKAGQPPVAVPTNDVDKIERITPAVGTSDKGGVRPAIEQGEKAGPKYEIHSMTVRNGPYTSTFFYDNSLSQAERDQLGAMERASNDLVQKSTMIESLRSAMDNAANDSGTTVVQTGTTDATPYANYFPVGYYNAYYYIYEPYFVAPGFAYPIGAGFPGYGYGYGYGGGSNNSTVVVRDSGSSGKSLAELAKSLSQAETALAEAQKNYSAVARRGIYDANGRIVAVRLEE